jgi:glycosyltransferase involved in cell wall biosynthesis
VIRILVLNERDPRHPRAGGAEVHIVETFDRLVGPDVEVTLLASNVPGTRRYDRWRGLAIERLGPLPLYYPRVAHRVARDTRAGRIDLIVECLNKVPYFTPLYSAAPVLALCHHLFGTTAFEQVAWPVAATVWGAELLIPAAYRRCPFVAISESAGRDLARRGVPAAQVRIIPPGVVPPAFPIDTTTPRPPRVAYVGRLEHYKRVDVFLRAMARVAERVPALEVVVVGRGTAQAKLERLAADLGLGPRTRFTGFVADAERDALLASTRVCVQPSAKEGFGLTVLEANAAGVPVVASDVMGLRDSVRDGETGYLVPPGDVAAFAARTTALLIDDALAARLATAALGWARRFDWDVAAAAMRDVIASALATNR